MLSEALVLERYIEVRKQRNLKTLYVLDYPNYCKARLGEVKRNNFYAFGVSLIAWEVKYIEELELDCIFS